MVKVAGVMLAALALALGPVVPTSAQDIAVPAVDTPWPGKIFVGHDEWVLSDGGFERTPNDSAALARNVAAWFTRGHFGRFLVYSTNFSLRGGRLATTMRNAGHSWTIGTDVPFTIDTLQQYNAVFLAGDQVDTSVLIDYVRAGGNVFLLGGTGIGGTAEAAHWNVFLNAFGLDMDLRYDPARQPAVYPIQSTSPLFNGVTRLYDQLGNALTRLDASNPDTQILVWSDQSPGRGIYAVYETPVVPMPVKICPSKVKVTATGRVNVWIAGTTDFDVRRIDLASLDLFGARPVNTKFEHKTAPDGVQLLGLLSLPTCSGKDLIMDLVVEFDRRTVFQTVERVLGRPLIRGERVALTVTGYLKPEYDGDPVIGETIIEVDR
jgi:hypothetical protein